MFFLVAAVFPLLLHPSASSVNLCSSAGLCCRHRDGNCVVQTSLGESGNGNSVSIASSGGGGGSGGNESATVDTTSLPCYCDHACVKLDDCCRDYKDFCGGAYAYPISNKL